MNASLAFEDLTNIRQSLNTKPRNKIERRRTNNWAFYQLRLFVGYKANIALCESGICPTCLQSVKLVRVADIFTLSRANLTVTGKFLSVGIVDLNMMLISTRLKILLLWGLL